MLTLLAGLTALATAATGPQTYATTTQNIRAGIVILDSSIASSINKMTGLPTVFGSSAPFALYNLDKATSVKPIGWNIYNPNSPGVVSQTMLTDWTSVEGTGGSNLPTLNAPLAKNNADYWAVYLDNVSDATLANYDLLLVNPVNYAELSSSEREKLEKFVDKGGILWIDTAALADSTTGQDQLNNFPLAFLNRTQGSGPLAWNPFDPLLSTPETITQADLSYILNGSLNFLTNLNTGADGVNPNYYLAGTAEFGLYTPVTTLNGAPTIDVGHIGNGTIVVTSCGLSELLNRSANSYVFGTGGNVVINDSFTAIPPVLQSDGLAAAKMAVNIISLGQDYAQADGGSRKTNSNAVDVTAPVLPRFQAEGQYGGGTTVPVPPAIYKNVIVAVEGNQVVVYDSNPSEDLDQDGNPDDGIPDYSLGSPVDIIWKSKALPEPISAPACASVPNSGVKDPDTGLTATDQVMVIDGQGTLHVWNLFPKNANGELLSNYLPGYHQEMYELGVPSDGYYLGSGTAPNAPTVDQNLVYIADNAGNGTNPEGRVWVADLSIGTWLCENASNGNTAKSTAWYVGGDNGTTLPGYTASPTVGYIPIQDSSGGYDKVLYAPGIIGSNFIPGFDSIWIGAKGETPFATDLSVAGQLEVTTRAGSNGNMPIYMNGVDPALAPKLTLLDANGNPVPLSNIVTGAPAQGSSPGIIDFPINQANYNKANVTGVRVDYTIDWGQGQGQLTQSVERGRLMLPYDQNGVSQSKRILGSLALSDQGTLCFTEGDPTALPINTGAGASWPGGPNGSLWWVKEDQGRGNFRVTGRYSLYPYHNIALSEQAGPTPYHGVLLDSDPLLNLANIPLLYQEMSGWRWDGPPSLRGNQLFATASAVKTYNGATMPVTVTMAFPADPPQITLTTNGLGGGFQLVQPDFDRSNIGYGASVPVSPDTTSTLTSGAYVYDVATGLVTLPNLATVTKGQIMDCLSLSQPVIIRNTGSPDTLVQPETQGNTWSPLQWFTVWPGANTQSGPLVTGQGTLYFAGSSAAPSFLNGVYPPVSQATLSAMDSQISASDTLNTTTYPGILPNTDTITGVTRPWQNQVVQIEASGLPDPHIRMPQAVGVTSFTDWLARLNQTVLGSSANAYGVVGGGSTLAAFGDQGLYGLSRADFVVCDEGRVIRTDSSGNVLYSSSSNINTGPGGGGNVGTVASLVRPTRAYPISSQEMLMVDTGGNRVVKVSNSGLEERSISSFFTDPNYKPSGYQTGESLKLNAPRDVVTWSGFVNPAAAGLNVSNPQPLEYWVYYLIADGGNQRLVEVADRFTVNNGLIGPLVTVSMQDPNQQANGGQPLVSNVPQAGVLVWQSPLTVSGKNYQYNSISRIFVGDGTGIGNGRYVYVAGIGSAQPSRADLGLDSFSSGNPLQQSGTGNGGIIIFDAASANPVQVFNTYSKPDLSGTPIFDPNTGKYDTAGPGSQKAVGTSAMSGLKSVTVRPYILNATTGQSGLSIMFTDATGVYEYNVDPSANTGGNLSSLNWMINSYAYRGMRTSPNVPANVPSTNPAGTNPMGFVPTYARRLDSGEVLIVNSYNGQTWAGSHYAGEVVVLNGTNDAANSANQNGEFAVGKLNLGFITTSLHFYLQTTSNGVRSIVSPIFADRR